MARKNKSNELTPIDPVPMNDVVSVCEKEESSEGIQVSSTGFCKWAIGQDGSYIPTFESVYTIPSGVYEIMSSPNIGLFLKKQKIIATDANNILQLPMPQMQEIVKDIEDFWSMGDKFKKYKMVHKRGILMHGPPGAGKSCLLQNIVNNILIREGVVFTLNTVSSVSMFVEFAQIFRQIEATRPLVVLIEDIDNIVTSGSETLSALLNVLDGINQIEHVVYLATTNYPERLQDRISNRPSRFDRVYEIPTPNAEVREYFIRHKLHKEDLERINMKQWVDETEGLSLAHIKELIVSTMIFDKTIEDVIGHFGEMKRPKSSRAASQNEVGFGFKKR